MTLPYLLRLLASRYLYILSALAHLQHRSSKNNLLARRSPRSLYTCSDDCRSNTLRKDPSDRKRSSESGTPCSCSKEAS
ncbi:hypothetical protein AUEXF2481DRAFT_37965 [Aureobasidium subglaciale EXF-2481]|uniref:Uncharacterized protein n=1 Tax=Aureobasidium subglaciale (strain EXF-2481) TaxID=1043005 RepID=A0A074YTI1_AURSE|nr:uncharacterized protein AUEXF2481DRAFT_37965 [Aureobasidium subglaciale EXF-2481]KEQ97447.1 hypothetical protein AUEXF2481DRAFT_37965 [Aureobasidium subglaciale EXF-2481]